ncbi:7724_t:CDS:1, partial [Paraglomus occultum]
MTAYAQSPQSTGFNVLSDSPCYPDGPGAGSPITISAGSRGVIACQVSSSGVLWDYFIDWGCYINDNPVDTCGTSG